MRYRQSRVGGALEDVRSVARSLAGLQSRPKSRAVAIAAALGLGVQLLGISISPLHYTRLMVRLTAPAYGSRPQNPSAIRDGLPFQHFIPEFSPIAGHFWLLRLRLAGDGAPPPWSSLGVPAWAYLDRDPAPGELDFWFAGPPPATPHDLK
jgi:hypothetical protein